MILPDCGGHAAAIVAKLEQKARIPAREYLCARRGSRVRILAEPTSKNPEIPHEQCCCSAFYLVSLVCKHSSR